MTEKEKALRERLKSSVLVCSQEAAFKQFPEHGEILANLANKIYDNESYSEILPFGVMQSAKDKINTLMLICFYVDTEPKEEGRIKEGINYIYIYLPNNDLMFTKALLSIVASSLCSYNSEYKPEFTHVNLLQGYVESVAKSSDIVKIQLSDCPEEYKAFFNKEVEIKREETNT